MKNAGKLFRKKKSGSAICFESRSRSRTFLWLRQNGGQGSDTGPFHHVVYGSGQSHGILSAGSGEMGGAATAALDETGGLAHDVSGMQAAALHEVLADHHREQRFALMRGTDRAKHVFGQSA